jgi:hypothetical protein
MKKIIIALAVILIASNCWSEVLSPSMTDIAKLKPLMGTWDFTHVEYFPNETSGITFTYAYTLNDIYKHEREYYIGSPYASAHYNDVVGNYYLSDSGRLSYYVFNFTGANAVAGTYWPHVFGNIIDLSFPFTGIKVAEVSPDPCPSSLIYGTDSEQTQLLRSIRDNILSKSHEGKELIKLYYQWSPVIVKAMEADEDFKADVKELVDDILEMIEVE